MQILPQRVLVPVSMGNLVERIYRGETRLEDFLDEADFVDAMAATRWRIIREFVEGGFGPGGRATIPGYDDIGQLAGYVQRQMNERTQRKIFAVRQLPEIYRLGASDAVRRFVLRHVVYQLIVRQLLAMQVVGDLWRVNGEWEIRSSVLDEYRLRRRSSKLPYYDDRSYHGRTRRDRSNGNAPGVSIGALA